MNFEGKWKFRLRRNHRYGHYQTCRTLSWRSHSDLIAGAPHIPSVVIGQRRIRQTTRKSTAPVVDIEREYESQASEDDNDDVIVISDSDQDTDS